MSGQLRVSSRVAESKINDSDPVPVPDLVPGTVKRVLVSQVHVRCSETASETISVQR